MGRIRSPLAVVPVLIVAACTPAAGNGVEGQETADPAPAMLGETPMDLSSRGEIVTVETQTGEAGAYSDNCQITETSIAGVLRPATLGAFAGAFPAGTSLVFEPSHMVDFGSLCLVIEGRERVCTLFYEAEVDGWRPEAEALGLYTRDPECVTSEGVGPGSAVNDAAEAFGTPEFRFNYDNEGREYVDFARAPDALSFRVRSELGEATASDLADRSTLWPNGDFGGNYRASAEDFVTNVAMDDAAIVEVSIY